MNFFAWFYFWMILSSCMLAMGQDIDDKESGKITGRKAWLIQTGIPEGLENPVKIMIGRDIQSVTLSNRMATGPIKIPSDGIIRLVREIPDPKNPEKTLYQTLAEAMVPEKMDQALIILVPVLNKAAEGRVFTSKVQGLTDFKGGDCLYINLTNVNVAIEIAESKIPLKPGDSKIFDGEAYIEATSVPFRYSYFHPEKKKWKVLTASLAIMSGTRREIWIFSFNANTDQVKCHGITFPVDS
jgi:hypothetical protein